jgi:hypothetical protein
MELGTTRAERHAGSPGDAAATRRRANIRTCRQGLLGSLWCWHSRPSCMPHGDRCPWRRSWSRVTAQGVSESPGRDARMPPGPRGWTFGWPGCRPECLETLGDPGPGGTDASPGFIQREPRAAGQVPGMSRWSRPLRSRVARGVRLPGTSAPCPAVTLSDTGSRGERAHCRLSSDSVYLTGGQ